MSVPLSWTLEDGYQETLDKLPWLLEAVKHLEARMKEEVEDHDNLKNRYVKLVECLGRRRVALAAAEEVLVDLGEHETLEKIHKILKGHEAQMRRGND